MVIARTCSKCGGSLSVGFVIDEGYGKYDVMRWQAGEPRRSFWKGLKTSKAVRMAVTTYRCDRCGFLESYAPDPSSTSR